MDLYISTKVHYPATIYRKNPGKIEYLAWMDGIWKECNYKYIKKLNIFDLSKHYLSLTSHIEDTKVNIPYLNQWLIENCPR